LGRNSSLVENLAKAKVFNFEDSQRMLAAFSLSAALPTVSLWKKPKHSSVRKGDGKRTGENISESANSHKRGHPANHFLLKLARAEQDWASIYTASSFVSKSLAVAPGAELNR
jgi:hypothetical protein